MLAGCGAACCTAAGRQDCDLRARVRRLRVCCIHYPRMGPALGVPRAPLRAQRDPSQTALTRQQHTQPSSRARRPARPAGTRGGGARGSSCRARAGCGAPAGVGRERRRALRRAARAAGRAAAMQGAASELVPTRFVWPYDGRQARARAQPAARGRRAGRAAGCSSRLGGPGGSWRAGADAGGAGAAARRRCTCAARSQTG
jgi:hypothetical protein